MENQRGTNTEENSSSISTLMDKGRLGFRRMLSPESESKLNQVKMTLIPAASHRDKDSGIILVGAFNEYKIYQVKDDKIHFVSSHQVVLPIDGEAQEELTANNSITYVFKKEELEKTEKNVKFFAGNGIEWDEPSSLLFRFKFSIGIQTFIKAEFIGEIRTSDEHYSGIELIDNLDSFKPLLGPRLAILSKIAHESDLDDKKYFLAQMRKCDHDLARSIFKFQVEYEKLKEYQQKLEKDITKIPNHLSSDLEFADQEFLLYNYEEDKPQKFKALVKVDEKMIAVALFEMRSKKIIKTKFISIYELVQDIERFEVIEELTIQVIGINYSPAVDTLALHIEAHQAINLGAEASLQPLVESELKAGRRDRSLLAYFHEQVDENDNLLYQIKDLSVKVFNVLRGGCKIEVESRSVGNGVNFLTERLKGNFITVDDSQKGCKVEILSPTKKSTKNGPERPISEKYELAYEHLFRKTGIKDRWVRAVSTFGGNRLLILFQSSMVLLDTHSKEILSSISYTSNLPTSLSYCSVRDGLVLSRFGENCLMLHQIIHEEDKKTKFKPIKIIDFRESANLHSLNKYLDFTKTGENRFNIRLEVNWMPSEESTRTEISLLSCDIEVNRTPEGRIDSVEQTEFEIAKIVHETDYSTFSSYIKGGNVFNTFTYHDDDAKGMLKRAGSEAYQFFEYSLDGSESENIDGEMKGLLNCHIGEKYTYFILYGFKVQEGARYPVKRLNAVTFKETTPQGELKNPEITKSIEIKHSSFDYFDKTTDEFRFFTLYQIHDKPSQRLCILNEELEEVSAFNINGLMKIEELHVINEAQIYIVGFGPLMELGQRAGYGHKSLLIDLEKKSQAELVGEFGEPFFGVPFALSDGRFFCLTKTRRSFLESEESEGVFVSSFEGD